MRSDEAPGDDCGFAIGSGGGRTRLSAALVESGVLMAYGPNLPAIVRRGGLLIAKILSGSRSRDLPVEQPTKFELFVNQTTAHIIGVEVPPTLLARADEVIE
jgi:ABC-type uncharacterized transport system substrate-binding protein